MHNMVVYIESFLTDAGSIKFWLCRKLKAVGEDNLGLIVELCKFTQL